MIDLGRASFSRVSRFLGDSRSSELSRFFRISLYAGALFLLTHCTQPGEPIDRHPNRLILTRHAHCRMDCRHITEREIREILEKGSINYAKSEPDAHPDPKYALEGTTQEGQHLRVIFAPSDRGMVVITCIDLGVEWQCDCK